MPAPSSHDSAAPTKREVQGSPTGLRVPRSVARREVRRQIAKGEGLLADLDRVQQSIPLPELRLNFVDRPNLKDLSERTRTWSNVNLAILERFFTTAEFLDKYRALYSRDRPAFPGVGQLLFSIRKDIQDGLGELRSIHEILPVLSSGENSMNEKPWVWWVNIAGSVASITGLSLLALNRAISTVPIGKIVGWFISCALWFALFLFSIFAVHGTAAWVRAKRDSTSLTAAVLLIGVAIASFVLFLAYVRGTAVVVPFVERMATWPGK